ncbi:hypothetical protein [Paenibacillus graminis]|uniref:hypothetical protein n=1 Tax=Paenibacillus graminis TaxID=189425 RepID=UPI002DBA5768|nr:hypothetical protein [Paenibacillus graminis]
MSTKDMEKLLGQVIEIIYEDKAGNITQRRIEVLGLKGGLLRAACLATGSPRMFRVERILAWQPIKGRRAG